MFLTYIGRKIERLINNKFEFREREKKEENIYIYILYRIYYGLRICSTFTCMIHLAHCLSLVLSYILRYFTVFYEIMNLVKKKKGNFFFLRERQTIIAM